MASTRGALFLKRTPADMEWVRTGNSLTRLTAILYGAVAATIYYAATHEERFDWWQLDPWVPQRRRTTKKYPGATLFYGWGNNALNRDCALLEWYCWRGYWGNEWGD
eukprot:TRINITY_DN5716_c1_g1_i1.p1 TRINITY_DN5716_c1_g1~~TRINITY_DN5716_c1_g1_i1.p1  ORF type:complete len:123 (+),score=20.74 TRINITY_DN5716_c1_g1_i1:51-371(+)